MLGDIVLTDLEKMKQTDQEQHNDGLLQEFYAMTEKHNDPIGWYAVRLDMAADKVCHQPREALGGTPEEWGRLLVDCLLRSMNPRLRARVAHLVDGKVVHQANLHSVPHNSNSLVSNCLLFRRPPSTPKITPLTQC